MRRVHALHDLRKQCQSANLTTQRQQVLEALPVVAANDQQIQNYHKTSWVYYRHRDDSITEKISSVEATTQSEKLQRGAVQKSIPPIRPQANSTRNTGHPRLCSRSTHEDRSSGGIAASAKS